jgi:hypothetical protein
LPIEPYGTAAAHFIVDGLSQQIGRRDCAAGSNLARQ